MSMVICKKSSFQKKRFGRNETEILGPAGKKNHQNDEPLDLPVRVRFMDDKGCRLYTTIP